MHAGAVWGMCKGGEAWWSLISAVIHSDINARDICMYGAYIQNIFIKVGRVTRRNKTKCSFEHFVRVCACVLHVCACLCLSVFLCRTYRAQAVTKRLENDKSLYKSAVWEQEEEEDPLVGAFCSSLLFFESLVVFMSHCAYKYTPQTRTHTHTWGHLSLALWWHVLWSLQTQRRCNPPRSGN